MNNFLVHFLIMLSFWVSDSNSQQIYSGLSVLSCNGTDESGPSSSFLYTCNGQNQSCNSFLIFRSSSPYNTIWAISKLMSVDPSELLRVNNLSSDATVLPEYKEVIVPVTCSCLNGQYYESNTSYLVKNLDNYFGIAFYIYQGLSTCDTLMKVNGRDKAKLTSGLRLQVPLRCACPTNEQISNGTRFLVTYVPTDHDSVSRISENFNISNQVLVSANELVDEKQDVHPLTTILIPLPNEPLSSQTKIQPPSVVSSPIPTRNQRKKSRKVILIGIGVGFTLAVLCLVLLLIYYNLWRKRSDEVDWRRKEQKKKRILSDFHDQMLKVYDFEELQMATDNFSVRNKLSESVYRGLIHDKYVAIKKMRANVEKEVEILDRINHFNLISLYGACEFDGLFYLVYEYMENGSLNEWLIKETGVKIQKWNLRIRIALDIAEGLHYIHNFTNPAYIHKGINSSNVLLNCDLRAKISNFSLAKSSEKTRFGYSSLRCNIGAKGYMAPEYLECCHESPKTDVYAFGVVLLELITGKEAVFKKDGEEFMLSEVVISSVDSALSWKSHLDPRLQVKHKLGFIIDRSELEMRMMELSLACLESDPSRRFNMAEVVSTLMKIHIDAQEPQEPQSVSD